MQLSVLLNPCDATQGPEMQTLLDKGLAAQSVEELGKLLSHLGLHCFVKEFKANKVSLVSETFVVRANVG